MKNALYLELSTEQIKSGNEYCYKYYFDLFLGVDESEAAEGRDFSSCHQSTLCSRWAIVTTMCLSSLVFFSSFLNLFPHSTILQLTTLNILCQKIDNLYIWTDNLWLKVENIVAKGEIARFEQFLLLSLCCQKASIYIYLFPA